jgi:hypothetical protein
MTQKDVKITKKEIWSEITILVKESERSTRLALFVIGLTLCGLTIPTLLKLFGNPVIVEVVFVILYFSFGIKIMVDEGLRLRKLKKELEELKNKPS